LALIIISVFISLPAYLQGIQFGQALGFHKSLTAFVFGSIILMVIGCFCGIVGSRTRLSTYMLTPYTFGIKGAKLVNVIVSITIFGWFGVVLAEFSEAVFASLQMLDIHFSDNLTLFSALGCFLMLATAIFGFKGLNLLANLVTPLLLFSSIMVIYLSIESVGFTAISAARKQTMQLDNAISTVESTFDSHYEPSSL
jgi:cytosine permease